MRSNKKCSGLPVKKDPERSVRSHETVFDVLHLMIILH